MHLALYYAKTNFSSNEERRSEPTATPLAAHPLIQRQLQVLCSQPDATQQLKEIGARSLAGGSSLASRLIDELTNVFVRLVELAHMGRYLEGFRVSSMVVMLEAGFIYRHATELYGSLSASQPTSVVDTQKSSMVGPIPGWWSSRPVDGTSEVDSPPSTNEDDARLRSYTEMWCRFILIVEPPASEENSSSTESSRVRTVDVVRAVLLALDLREAVRLRFRRLERLHRASLLVRLVEAMLTWVSPATDEFKYSLLEYLGHPFERGRPVSSAHISRFVKRLQRLPQHRSLADFCELRLLLHPELSSVQQLRALRQASLRDRQDLRLVISAVEKVPKPFRDLGRLRLSLSPFEERTEVIDGVPWAPLRLTHPEEAVQLRLQLQLMRVLRELGVYESEEVFRAVAVEAVREHTVLVALFIRELCAEDVPLFLSGDRVSIEGGEVLHLTEGMAVPLFDELGQPVGAGQETPPRLEGCVESSFSSQPKKLSLFGSLSTDSLAIPHDESELTLEGVDEAVGALVSLPSGLRFFNVASRHKSKPTKKAVERDARLLRTLLHRVVDARAALEAKLKARAVKQALGERTQRDAGGTGGGGEGEVGGEGGGQGGEGGEGGGEMLPGDTLGEGKGEGRVVVGGIEGAEVDAADLHAYGGLDECLFHCLESVLLVVATSESSRQGALAASRDGHYRAFAELVVGDLVAAFSDPSRLLHT
ncbi:MAG: hypothetical protein SGPRY_001756 [Prymnesium sp.]